MISISNLSIHFSGTYLFNDISFIINRRDRIGLVGRNGAGKTTLLKIITGIMDPEKGSVAKPSGTTIGYLPQEKVISSNKSVFDETLTAFDETIKLESKINKLNNEIATRTDYESDSYIKLIARLNDANERYKIIGGATKEADTEKVLIGLGFTYENFHTPLQELSGGWQMRIELAKIILQKPDVLLLDEPTNHLDIESIQWLEEFLINYPGAVILVSHDRALLDKVTKRTIEISQAKIYDYKVSYSDYVLQREEGIELQQATYNNQQRQIASTERFIERFRYKNTKSKQVQSRIKMLDKLDKVEVDSIDTSAIHFSFPPSPHCGKVVLEAKDIEKSYGDNLVLKDVNFAVIKKESIAFVGKNGEGKTTLSRIIVGDLEYEGESKLGHNVKIGYYAQDQAQLLDPNKTVFQTIDDVAVGEIRTKVRTILGSFLFSDDTIEKKVKVLSGGEKSRLALAQLLLTPVNLLILDEPTNHLDMQSKDILKNALLKYDGAMIIVSHDRDFLQGLTNRVFEFKNRNISQYIGDIYDFLESRKLRTLKQLEKKKRETKRKTERSASDNKLQFERKKRYEKERRKLNNQIKKSEIEISRLEDEKTKIDDLLSNPEKYDDDLRSDEVYRKYEELKNEIETEMNNWEKLSTKLEELDNEFKSNQ
ncbi:MAG: ABC-F family ATP-binding cassette domain-containing protein [Bacteroidales bacterium]|nr:ABC-F family ATP-binding cassette domain-containing protein [Bacteroidales bacterium]